MAARGWTTPGAVMMAETLGRIRCGGVPMAIGVQTDMATRRAGALRFP